jgi:hypothetical protein
MAVILAKEIIKYVFLLLSSFEFSSHLDQLFVLNSCKRCKARGEGEREKKETKI